MPTPCPPPAKIKYDSARTPPFYTDSESLPVDGGHICDVVFEFDASAPSTSIFRDDASGGPVVWLDANHQPNCITNVSRTDRTLTLTDDNSSGEGADHTFNLVVVYQGVEHLVTSYQPRAGGIRVDPTIINKAD